MKRKWILLSLVATTFLAGCQPTTQKSSKGNALFVSEESTASQSIDENSVTTIQDELAKYSESQRTLLNQVNFFYQNLKGVKVTSQVTSPDTGLSIQQATQETYESGKLTGYTSDITTSNNGQSYQVKYYFNGKDNYTQAPYQAWEQTNNANAPTVYLYMMRLLFEGSDKITMEEGLDQPILSKTVTDPEQVKLLGYFFNLPINIGANTTRQAQVDYQVDKETGQVVTMNATITVEAEGKTTTFKVHAKTEEDKELTSLTVDTDAAADKQEVAEGQFLEQFKKANPVDAIYMYEMTWGIRTTSSDQAWLQIVNTWNNQNYQIAEAEIIDKKAENYRLIYQNKGWSLKDDQVASQGAVMGNYYRDFANRFAEQYSSLTKVEPSADATDVKTTTYREQYEDDPTSFKAAAGEFDVSGLITDGHARYTIDYVVNNETLQLEAVYFWRVLPEDTEITTVNTLSFRHLNTVTPSVINGVINEKVWEALKQ